MTKGLKYNEQNPALSHLSPHLVLGPKPIPNFLEVWSYTFTIFGYSGHFFHTSTQHACASIPCLIHSVSSMAPTNYVMKQSWPTLEYTQPLLNEKASAILFDSFDNYPHNSNVFTLAFWFTDVNVLSKWGSPASFQSCGLTVLRVSYSTSTLTYTTWSLCPSD